MTSDSSDEEVDTTATKTPDTLGTPSGQNVATVPDDELSIDSSASAEDVSTRNNSATATEQTDLLTPIAHEMSEGKTPAIAVEPRDSKYAEIVASALTAFRNTADMPPIVTLGGVSYELDQQKTTTCARCLQALRTRVVEVNHSHFRRVLGGRAPMYYGFSDAWCLYEYTKPIRIHVLNQTEDGVITFILRRHDYVPQMMRMVLGTDTNAIGNAVHSVQASVQRVCEDTSRATEAMSETARSWNFTRVFDAAAQAVRKALDSKAMHVTLDVFLLLVLSALGAYLATHIPWGHKGVLGIMQSVLKGLTLTSIFINQIRIFRELICLAFGINEDTPAEQQDHKAPESNVDQPNGQVTTTLDVTPTATPVASSPAHELKGDDTAVAGRVCTQGGDEHLGLSSLLAVLGVFAHWLGTPTMRTFQEDLKNVRSYTIGISTVTGAVDYITARLPEEYRLALYNRFGFGLPPDIAAEDKQILIGAYDVIHAAHDIKQPSPEIRRQYSIALGGVNQLLRKYACTNAFMERVLTSLQQQLGALSQKIGTILESSIIRFEPFNLWVCGPPGAGKTKLRTDLAKDLFADFPTHMRCFTGSLVDRFASGYCGQAMYYVDDVGSDVNTTAESKIIPQFLTWASTSPTQMNMAFEKGYGYSSLMNFFSSNATPQGVIQAQHMTCPAAVLRRFIEPTGLMVKMVLEPGFVRPDGVADVEAIQAQPHNSQLDYEHVRFHVLDVKDEKELETLTYRELVNRLLMLYMRHLTDYNVALQGHVEERKENPLFTEMIAQKAAMHMRAPATAKPTDIKVAAEPAHDDIMKALDGGAVEAQMWSSLVGRGEQKRPVPQTLYNAFVLPQFSHAVESYIIDRKLDDWDLRGAHLKVCDLIVKTFRGSAVDAPFVPMTYDNGENFKILFSQFSPEDPMYIQCLTLHRIWCESRNMISAAYVMAHQVDVFYNPVSHADITRNWFDQVHRDLKTRIEDKWVRVRDVWVRASDAAAGIPHWGTILSAFTIVGLFAGVVSYAAQHFAKPNESDDESSEEHGRSEVEGPVPSPDKKERKKRSWKGQYTARRNVSSHSSDICIQSQETPYVYARALTSNYVDVRICSASEGRRIRGLGLIDHVLLMNRHMLVYNERLMTEPVTAIITRAGKDYEYQIHPKQLTEIHTDNGELVDLVLWRMPKEQSNGMPCFANIVKHFATRSEIRDFYDDDRHVYMHVGSESRVLGQVWRSAMRASSERDEKSSVIVPSNYCLEYKYSTRVGDCGSVIGDGTRLFGMHTWGRYGLGDNINTIISGLALIIDRELLESTLNSVEVQGQPFIYDYMVEQGDDERWTNTYGADTYDTPENFVTIGRYTPANVTSAKTHLIPTGMWSCDLVPVPLSKRDPKCPQHMRDNPKSYGAQLLSKFSDYHEPLPVIQMDLAVGALVTRVGPPHTPVRLLDFDECLNPPLEYPGIHPLNLSTSPGPLFKPIKAKGKHGIINFDEVKQRYVAEPVLVDRFNELDKAVCAGGVPNAIWASIAKDDLMNPDKIERKGAREISGSPADLCLIARRYFGVFYDTFMNKGLDWGHALHLNPFSADWDRMVKFLKMIGDHGFSIDVKAFDSTMSTQFMWKWCRYVCDWYDTHGDTSRVNRRARYAIMHAIIHNYVQVGYVVSQKPQGNPSGSPLTTIVNCFWMRTMLMMAYMDLVRPHYPPTEFSTGMSAMDFFNVIHDVCLGDDTCMSVHDDILQYFNMDTLAKYWAEYGITITPAHKDAKNTEPWENVEDMMFLQCTTIVRETGLPGAPIYCPYIQDATVDRSLAYYRKGPNDMRTQVRMNMEDTLRRLWWSGPERFGGYYKRFQVAYEQKFGDNPQLPDYESFSVENGAMPSREGAIVPQASTLRMEGRVITQGITFSTSKVTQHLSNVATANLPTTSNLPIENKTDVDAKVGQDMPNIGQSYAGLVRTPFPGFGSTESITFATPMDVSPVYEPTQNIAMADIDDLDIKRACRPTWFKTCHVLSSDVPGALIASWPLTPMQCMHGAVLEEERQVSALCYFSSLYGFWRGSIHYSLQCVAPALATGRIILAVLWNTDTVPASLTAITSQAYATLEINAGSNTLDVDIPYTAPTRLLENYNGQAWADFAGGVVAIVLLHPYCVPAESAQAMYIECSEGAGPDFELYEPLKCNRTLVPHIPGVDPIPEPEVEEFETEVKGGRVQTQMEEVAHVANVNSGAENTVLLNTGILVTDRDPHPISDQKQSLRAILRMPQCIRRFTGDTDFVISHGLFTKICDTSQDGCQYTGVSMVCAPFKVWSGSTIYHVVSGGSVLKTWISYHPRIGGDSPITAFSLPEEKTIGRTCEPPFTGTSFAAPYCAVSVPFTSRYSGCEIRQTNTFTREECPGDLLINVKQATHGMVVFSGGDGLNVGVPYILPNLVVRSVSVDPDRYPTEAKMKASHRLGSRVTTQMEETKSPTTGVADNKVGVAMVETKDQKVSVADAKTPPAQSFFVSQPQLDMKALFERPQFVATTEWHTTDTTGAILWSRNVPHSLLENTAAMTRAMFKLFRCDVEFTMKVNGTRYHAGRLIATFVPMTTAAAAATSHAARKATLTWLPHMFLDAQASASASLLIPYRHIYPYLFTSSMDFGSILLSVFSPLLVGTGGITTLPVSIFVRFPNAQLRVLAPYTP